MKIKCEKCGAEIGAENINIQEMAAVCSKCNNIFKIQNLVFVLRLISNSIGSEY